MLHLHSSSYSSYSVLFFSSTSLLVQLYALGDLSIMFFLCHICRIILIYSSLILVVFPIFHC